MSTIGPRPSACSLIFGLARQIGLGLLLTTAAAAQSGEVVVATTGGVYDRALKEIWFEPFTKATGIKVATVTATDAEQRTRAQAMAKAGSVTWDIINNVDIIAESEQNRSFTRDLTSFCEQFVTRKDLVDKACNPSGVRITLNATLLAVNTDDFKNGQPKNWADFWDIKRFPGARALPSFNDPWRVLAAALLADGVPADKLFPLDIDRAIKKLDAIKPQVQLWWRTGDQSQQGFRNREYVVGMIWGTRASALKTEGQPVGTSYEGAFLLADTMQVLRDGPNPAGAEALLKYYLDNPTIQAKLAEKLNVTPPSTDAVALMSEAARANIPSSPEAFRAVVKHDTAWIAANQARMLNAWNAWIQR
ncbi:MULTISPECIES: ABC transporter substrate-binding protein [unclassified Chelatococcus]|uniref:ABC transporter substrate-binding protein n=1 Tax=unclassified Chelatococcus TaxID=2638111 RepID=UPI001BD14FE8|nr:MULTISPECIES: ABC transporter substrate-binding protein [unclassified Chelatococcus]MBS7699850.1 ABC transporter substrate-binding protein [Chelatococcus sp. YT9]MBX3558804.1 ABC transporter substrate-binding protein [Chelatococcus sp.]